MESIIPEMQDACTDLAAEIKSLETDIEIAMSDSKKVIGDLSDLRYGKFGRLEGISGDAAQEVVASLRKLTEQCEASHAIND